MRSDSERMPPWPTVERHVERGSFFWPICMGDNAGQSAAVNPFGRATLAQVRALLLIIYGVREIGRPAFLTNAWAPGSSTPS
jgi:hypothetical protein